MSALRQFKGLSNALRTVSLARSASTAVPARASIAARLAPRAAASASRVAARAFSASTSARSEGSSDAALSAKLQEELTYEETNTEGAAPGTTPEFLKAFQEQGIWTIVETQGSDEVTLTRKFGNEQIKLVFSISDVDQNQEDEFPTEEEDGEMNEDQPFSYPIRTSITITKPSSKGALVIDALAQDGAFLADSIAYYSDASVANGAGAEADWARRGLYFGPQFAQLDVAVQEEFERYLSERGIDESLALFIPDYAEYKEQKEYVSWLSNVKTFIDV
ncbi:mitochondrial glyco protein [Exidia glandulosa HHB12029]|uniref:Mitochondrial glyco protein n=1 Tax=Exidia glandulosa HHB12029 TaxID=1314781 RepID=A0A165LQ57_EXIGL|nr:mitochondrial glyco protein [Exidia glandulosa HHB12029]